MRRWPSRVLGVALVLVVLVDLAVVARPRQVRAYLTHWRGSPTHTEPYVPYADAPDVVLAVAGDIGDSGSRLDRTAEAIGVLDDERSFDALLLLGDNVYPRGDPDLLEETVFVPFAPVLDQGTRLLAILGNHDVKDGNGPRQVEALGMDGRWWSTVIGDVLLVGLDSNDRGNADQLAWLERTLRGSTARWKIVALHHPPYSAGYQGSSEDVRAIFSPLFERHGVQLVLSGHDHDYQRSKVIGGVTYIVSGGGAGTRRTSTEWFTEVSFSWHHFLEIAAFDDRLVVRAINQDGRVADEVAICP